jgi:hypothetical protein
MEWPQNTSYQAWLERLSYLITMKDRSYNLCKWGDAKDYEDEIEAHNKVEPQPLPQVS